MTNEKQEIIATINTLPDDITWEDALYALYMQAKLKRSEDDIKNGRVITLEELDKEMEAKYENYSVNRG